MELPKAEHGTHWVKALDEGRSRSLAAGRWSLVASPWQA